MKFKSFKTLTALIGGFSVFVAVTQAWQRMPLSMQPQAILSCRVTGISDGDTLTCLTAQKQQLKVRLHGIDAPEKAQAYGQRAKQHLSDLVYGKNVTLRIADTDRYGRRVAQVVSGSLNVNQQMVQDGYAWAYRQYGGDVYVQDEAQAKSQRLGLWRDANPINPAEFRRNKNK